jgi:hypothetical protein
MRTCTQEVAVEISPLHSNPQLRGEQTARALDLLAEDLGVPSPERSAGANQERDATFQAHDQCRRELSLGHPCGQVPS